MRTDTRTAPRTWSVAMLGTLAVTAVPIAGWLVGSPGLASLGSMLTPMAPATTVAFLVLLAAILIRRWAPVDRVAWKLAAAALPATVGLGALLILAPVLFRAPVYIERWLFPRVLGDTPPGVGLMSEVTALLLIAQAAYLLLLLYPEPQPALVGLVGAFLIAAGLGLVTGYVYGAPYLYRTRLLPPSLPTALGLAGLGLASLLTSGRSTWPLRLFVGPGIPGRLLRRLFPICVVVILAHAWLGSIPALPARDRAVLSSLLMLGALTALLILIVRAAGAVGRDADRAMGERWVAEAALQEERAVLRNLIDHLPFAVFIKDRESRFVVANTPAAHLCGVSSAAAMVGKRDFDYFPADEARSYFEDEQRIIRTGEPVIDRISQSRGPQVRTFRVSKFPLRDAAGNTTGLIGVISDISATKRTEEELARTTTALQEREALHRILFDSAADAMLFHDDQGVLLDVNAVACSRLGYTREELVGRHLSAIDSPPFAQRIEDRMADLLRQGSALFESEHRARDGRLIPVEVHARVVDYRGRRVVFSVSRDITERKISEQAFRAQEERARQGQKMEAVGRLAGGVAHDFNNILTVIQGYSDLLLEILGRTHPARTEVLEIRSAAERASSLTRQLLAFSRKQILHPEPFDTNEMLRSMYGLLQRMIGEDVELALQLAVLPGFAVADRNQIEQVIVNLAANARDAMPRGGRLILSTAIAQVDNDAGREIPDLAPGSYAVVSVTDTGTGIAAEQLGLIFEPFYTTKEKGKGTGLGLPTAYGIVRQSGGTITVHTETGKGSTFRVYLPLSAKAPGETAPPEPAPERGTETVLIAEDEEPVRTFAERVFRDHGYTVLAASSGAEAMAVAAGHTGPIDLLVTDVVMPGMGGRELAERLAALRPGLKVLHVSGYTEDAILRRGVLEPGVRFLAKPYSAAEILAQARVLLDAR